MFGLISANLDELTGEEKNRYNGVYCGICRSIREQVSSAARLSLSYDMAFLALLLMSLYEPAETAGERACEFHPVKPHPWVDNECVRYCARMNTVLGYYNALDDYEDEGRLRAKWMAEIFGKELSSAQEAYPRQCGAIEQGIRYLKQLEKDGCDNPDIPAGCFGALLGELFVYREDLWAPELRQMGDAIGRFIYLADAAMDYHKDRKHNHYNPFIAMGMAYAPDQWEQYLVLAMGRCTESFERLPLVQDKGILDNILYSGVWVAYRKRMRSKKNDR